MKYLDLMLWLMGIKKDENIGFKLVTRIARRLIPHYRFTWPELAWFRKADINQIIEKFDGTISFNAHRRLALQQLVRLSSPIEGDTAECGVYKGCGSWIILEGTQGCKQRKHHHVFDSFEGLSSPSGEDGEHWCAGSLKAPEELVAENLDPFRGRFTLYKGWIPSRFPEIRHHVFSFVHVDVDLLAPTYDSISFFYDRLNNGGILLCDDYGFLTCPGATSVIDDFLMDKPEKMLLLPGGGGFFIKGCEVAAA